jgi:hypothetical protein
VYDFDERICQAVKRFADQERLEQLDACLYNCLDALPPGPSFDYFYTNPPWGASNDGNSVTVFVQRGMEAVQYGGEGIVVIADDDGLDWPKRVLAATQLFALDRGFFIQKMASQLHQYHLDDNPDLRSCNLLLRALPGNRSPGPSEAVTDRRRLVNFYGRDRSPSVRYVREKERLDYGKAHVDEYYLELMKDS